MAQEILHSRILGEGKPFLILHGYFGMSDNWKTLGNRFAEHFQVHLIDLRNHGRSFHAREFNYDLINPYFGCGSSPYSESGPKP